MYFHIFNCLHPYSTLFTYTTLFRSPAAGRARAAALPARRCHGHPAPAAGGRRHRGGTAADHAARGGDRRSRGGRSEERRVGEEWRHGRGRAARVEIECRTDGGRDERGVTCGAERRR